MARDSKKAEGGIRWRRWLGLAGLGIAGVSTAVAGFKVRDYALTDPQFLLSRDVKDAITIQGSNYAPRAKVLRIFSGDYGRSVFSVNLNERRRRLLAIDWVEDASVSRIWPDRLVVRIRERKPVAFVSFRSGVLLIDAHGVLLEQPSQAQVAFPVLSGVREDEPEERRRERVSCLLRVQEELGSMAKDISEVNTADPDNVRITTQVDRRTVELIMGDTDFAARYRNFMSHYQEIQRRLPGARTFDVRLADRITAED
ncbi:MAG TPA: FtsQ-type POTRA domain-containing protein [Bryobacteraceae bacterium]|nr:FtsQ-type POTRA domain-containing protein [Bryobacteraceae bacterium]